jgi:hypothetical protein
LGYLVRIGGSESDAGALFREIVEATVQASDRARTGEAGQRLVHGCPGTNVREIAGREDGSAAAAAEAVPDLVLDAHFLPLLVSEKVPSFSDKASRENRCAIMDNV